jgi:hypothetical protein
MVPILIVLYCIGGKMPIRIQRRRTKGWKMPQGVIYVGRGTVYGNHYSVERYGRDRAIDLFERDLNSPYGKHMRAQIVVALAGKDLACWCKLDEKCHADVLLRTANDPPPP